MKFDQFQKLWDNYTNVWLETDINGQCVRDLCVLCKGSSEIVYEYYNGIKSITKDMYFNADAYPLTVSRYKRASIIAYAILKSNPLELTEPKTVDDLMLKQRLAFFMAVISIIQDFDKKAIEDRKIFKIFEEIDQRGTSMGNDSFLISVYKDMLFSELYGNYNILTMANVFGLLMEEVVGLKDIPLRDK